jgi:hypothetical protein
MKNFENYINGFYTLKLIYIRYVNNFNSFEAIKKALFIMILIFGTFHMLIGQSVGDYRSNGSGNWNTLGTWQRLNSVGPEVWAAPTGGQGYPGQNSGTGLVTIRDGDDVSLNVSPANGCTATQSVTLTNILPIPSPPAVIND